MVHAGVWDLHRKDGREQQLTAKAIFVHPQYDRQSHQNDIALIYMEKPVLYNDRVKPICLSDSHFTKPGKMCSVAGWGVSFTPQSVPRTLLHNNIPVVSREECNRESAYGGRVHSTMVCAGYSHGGGDNCYGDGGSALMCQDASNKWVISGINSWGEGCGLPGKFGVYTKVAPFKSWIEQVMSNQR